MTEGIVDRLQAVDIEHNQRAACVIAFDVGDGAIDLALKAAPVRNAEQEVGFRGCLQVLNALQRSCEFVAQPAESGPGAIGCDRNRSRARRRGLAPTSGTLAALAGPSRECPGS